ncbi:uncharacterized protein ASPGLDRAFT_926833 [Aspergillus glaucus CBS 516.65]|uniref:ATPase inhibitor, mitochondrial n=1 Tax=Aspergillus glaucus CBS 516.65 TaxID=1160497 RepID=A0A1L9V7P1_ASPGL|nr:hypothetical protein ASPGLDRAFT_926833 [Aspergillus glaucus CBS 516.65]OJJ79931.1 hypothetical protein ASPGLDRAFT_926833 [Aspergillus glaucus CBS 516.65]
MIYLSARAARIGANRQALPLRSFSIAVPARKEGDLGSPKPRGFLAEKDSFSRREAAYEAMYIRSHEAEKLKLLQSQLKEQRRYLDAMEEHIKEITRSQGGELN